MFYIVFEIIVVYLLKLNETLAQNCSSPMIAKHNKHEALHQRWINFGPTSVTLAHRLRCRCKCVWLDEAGESYAGWYDRQVFSYATVPRGPKCLAMQWRWKLRVLVAMGADVEGVVPRENSHAMYWQTFGEPSGKHYRCIAEYSAMHRGIFGG